MNPLFSRSSLMILESLSFTKTLYAFDFDGTLSKIVSDPTEAVITPTTNKLICKLSKLVPVAIISGRSIDDLKEKLRFKPHYIVGNHGLEGLNYPDNALKQAQECCREWKDILSKNKFIPGIEVEDKMYSLAIHYRRSRHKKKAREQIINAISNLSPKPRIVNGKFVFNILPVNAPHKGLAVVELMKKLEANHVFYIGDDDTDEDVFTMSNYQPMMTVRVGEKKSSSARFYIKRQSEINHVLRQLLKYHEGVKAHKNQKVK